MLGQVEGRGRRGAWCLAFALAVGALAGCTGTSGGGSAGRDWSSLLPDAGWECVARDAWQVRGFEYGHFASVPPGELLAATLRRGDVVSLELVNRLSTACGGSVVSVEWRSAAPEVAALAARGPLGAELRAVARGETRVSADVTLSDGSRQEAALYSVPSPGSPLVRVYTVRVIP